MNTGLKFDNPEYPTVATIPVVPDQELMLNASASADGGVQYKWYCRDRKTGAWMFLEDVTGATCKVNLAKSKYYKCEIYDKYGQGLDTQFQLTIDTGLESSIVEKTVTVPYGGQAVLTADTSDATTNYGPLSYEWYKVTEDGDERLEKVATVNAKGKVTAKKAGTAVITVKADGVVRTCTVTVK